MANPAEEFHLVMLDLHAATATVAPLAAFEFAINQGHINRTIRQARLRRLQSGRDRGIRLQW